MSMTMITLIGTFMEPNGTGGSVPAVGWVGAKATGRMYDSAAHVEYTPEMVSQVINQSTGAVSLQVPATDDTTTTFPAGAVQYTIIIDIEGVALRTFTIPLPHTTTTVDISAL